MQADATISSKKTNCPAPHKKERHKDVFAPAVTRMVFKKGRLTVPPQRAFEICGLLSASTAESPTAASHTIITTGPSESGNSYHERILGEIVSYKETNLPIVRLERGWDAVRELFREEHREEQLALTEYRDFMW
jgi:hypothetical protein